MRQYFNTLEITRGFLVALVGSLFLYLSHWGIGQPMLHTLLGIAFFYLLLPLPPRLWFWTGFFGSLFWFWWIGLSFIHYHMPWAIPFVLLFIAIVYGTLFWAIATLAKKAETYLPSTLYPLPSLILKSLGLLSISYIHPFGFDWYKPELVFVQSFLGIEKWRFALILLAITLAHWRKQPLFLLLALLAFNPLPQTPHNPPGDIAILTTYTTIEEKWDRTQQPKQYQLLLNEIDKAVTAKKSMIILPESVFPLFLNRNVGLFNTLKARAKKINIITGALYWDGKTPRNSTYIFTRDGRVTVANKVVLVPFGERNPLPDFLGKWVNRIFFDDAVDYTADRHISDYSVNGTTYRNAICFEATSETLYAKDPQGHYPKKMIVLSNNGWFVPSVEPTLQRLLLQYYSRKYGTTIYHAVNMSPSYVIQNGRVIYIDTPADFHYN